MAFHSPDRERIDSISLPPTLADAIQPLPYCWDFDDFISHKDHNGKEIFSPRRLNFQNHAFYVGKFKPQSFSERLFDVLGWVPRNHSDAPVERIYSDQTFEAFLHYFFSKLQNGERARIVVAPELSVLCNGPEDAKGALSGKEQIAYIHALAKRFFPKNPEFLAALDVIDVAEAPLHVDLFRTLRDNFDQHESRLIVEDLFPDSHGAPPLSEHPTSLEIAHFLYWAAQQDHRLKGPLLENPRFVPERLKDKALERPSIQYYGFFEIAIRLTDILHGKFIHGGVDRQGVYDEVISKVIGGARGEKGFKNVQVLKPLFDLFSNEPRFETVHLNTKESYFHRRSKKRKAQARLGFYAGAAAALFLGPYAGLEYVQHRQEASVREEMDHAIEIQLRRLKLISDQESPAFALERFYSLVDRFQADLRSRYPIPHTEFQAELKTMIIPYLFNQKSDLVRLQDATRLQRIDAVDDFVRDNPFFFISKGIDATWPYRFLRVHADMLRRALDDPGNSQEHPYADAASYSHYIDSYQSLDQDSQELPLFIYPRYPVRDQAVYGLEERFSGVGPGSLAPNAYAVLSPGKAHAILKDLEMDMNRYAVKPFLAYQDCFDDAFRAGELSDHFRFSLVVSPQDSELKPIGRFEDYFKRFDYELAVFEDAEHGRLLVARRFGDSTGSYSAGMGVQAAVHFQAMVESFASLESRTKP